MAYEALYSEKYYRDSWNELFMKYRKDWNFEHDLSLMIPEFDVLPEEAREKAKQTAKKIMAQKIARVAQEDLTKQMQMIQRIKEGKGSLGYTSKKQEIERWHELQEEFEFACLQLADFKKKYDVG